MNALMSQMAIGSGQSRRLIEALTGQALNGPFLGSPRRFSAINRDGVPFQWSVSVGSHRGGLRFIADCGVPGTPISERIRYTRTMLTTISTWLPLSGNTLCALDIALARLLPPADLLDASLMGLCVAAELARDGTARLKVYVNGEVGDVRERYRRFAECLIAFDRRTGLEHLRDLIRTIGDRLVPAFVAVDLGTAGIGRLKLYFRPRDGTPALQALAAEAAGCTNAAAMLDSLHHNFLIGRAYPTEAVDISVEFPTDDMEPGFKVDLRTINLLDNDAEVDCRILRLLKSLRAPHEDYQTARDIIVGSPAQKPPPQIVFAGLASRQDEYQVDVYFHPLRRKAHPSDSR
jgi:hypothetical protein